MIDPREEEDLGRRHLEASWSQVDLGEFEEHWTYYVSKMLKLTDAATAAVLGELQRAPDFRRMVVGASVPGDRRPRRRRIRRATALATGFRRYSTLPVTCSPPSSFCSPRACTVAPPVRVEDEAFDVLLQEVREAIGADALFRPRAGVTLSGVRIDASGVSRSLSISARPSGAFVESLGDGATSARGFDGRDAWALRPDGVVRRLSLGSREHMLADGWLRTHLWLVPGAERFEVTVDESSSSATRLSLRLTRDEGRLSASVELDRLTMLPAAYEISRFGRTRRVTFADWASGDLPAGARFPRVIE